MSHNNSARSTPRSSSVTKRSAKSIACQRCHSRKVKCSGGNPCSNCQGAGDSIACVYPSRDRQVKLSEQYIEEILKENERLRNARTVTPTPVPTDDDNTIARSETVRNPLLEENSWFHPVSYAEPIHVGEAADSAFATRFRQTLAAGNTKHLPRMDYIRDEALIVLSRASLQWPSPARARFLVKVALSTVCQYYHIVRRSQVLKDLEEAIKSNGNGNRPKVGRLLALFALGEVYSAKYAAPDKTFPGLSYFAQARKIIGIPAERPQMDTIEISLLLALFSFAVNRRHGAYIFASSACRLGLLMGLNMNVPEHQYRDRLAREHRIRLWWAAYTIDRACASKLGLPVSVANDDIMVDLPSTEGLETAEVGDFEDTDYILNSIKLSTLAARLTRAIYSRRNHHEPFLKRVQAMLKDLTIWMDALPEKFHLKENEGSVPMEIIYLQLRFNQCCILATRPILLYVLRNHKQSWDDPEKDPNQDLPEGAQILSETCIQCARHTYRIATEAWIHGTFATLDYFDAQYLYSATTVLAISSLLGSSRSRQDGDDFKNAVELLRQLSQSGNYGAKEFIEQIDAMTHSMQLVSENRTNLTVPPQELPVHADPMLPFQGQSMTAGMALADPSLQYFLTESDLDIQALSNPALGGLNTPYWPEMWGDGWGVGADV